MAGAITELDLEESVWSRAKRDAGKVYRSTPFEIGGMIGGVLAGAGGIVVISDSDSAPIQAAIAVLIGVGAVLGMLLGVLAAQLAAAAVRQRNELRNAWPRLESPSPAAIEMKLSALLRRGDDILRRVQAARGTHGAEDSATLDRWTDDVETLLFEHCDPGLARRFSNASLGEERFVWVLKKRLAVLERELDGDRQAAA